MKNFVQDLKTQGDKIKGQIKTYVCFFMLIMLQYDYTILLLGGLLNGYNYEMPLQYKRLW